jgi:hypothetical protein
MPILPISAAIADAVRGKMIDIPYLHAPGHATMSIMPRIEDQIFSFTPHGETETYHFHIARLIKLAFESIRHPPEDRTGAHALNYCFPEVKECNMERAMDIVIHNNVELSYVRSMEKRRLNFPGMICMFPPDPGDGADKPYREVLVDGNHRFVRRALNGETTMNFCMVPQPIWKQCLLKLSFGVKFF